MRTGQRVTLSGRSYMIAPLPAGIALRIFTRIVKAVGPALATLAKIDDLAGLNVSSLLDHLAENDAELISRDFATQTQVELVPGSNNLVPLATVFDDLFGGSLDEWFEWFVFCAELNFRPLVAKAAAKMKSSAAAPSTAAASPPP